jgi:hypothetical protein
MKKKILLCCALLLSATVAFAEWQVDFLEKYKKEGIDQAVIVAIQQGALPVEIVENGLKLEGLNPQNLIKALYCAGANGADIAEAAKQYDTSDMILTAGFKKATEECADQVADAQAYTPVAPGLVKFGGVPVPAFARGTYRNASPARF